MNRNDNYVIIWPYMKCNSQNHNYEQYTDLNNYSQTAEVVFWVSLNVLGQFS